VLLSGSYIGMLPSTEKASRSELHRQPGSSILRPPLREQPSSWRPAAGLDRLGSPIFFRDLDVGAVLSWDLGDLANSVTIHFVRAPFDQYVHDN
jgi:paraquat-inducible protein B